MLPISNLFAPYVQLANEASCSPAQLALAWLLHKAPHIIPIPGTTSEQHLLDDLGATNVQLSTELLDSNLQISHPA